MNIKEKFELLPTSSEGSLSIDQLDIIEEVSNIVRPGMMLEIGFNIGKSAVMWLESSSTFLFSIDDCGHLETEEAVEIVKEWYPDRFYFIECDSLLVYPKLKGKTFNLAFIDGGHEMPYPISDLFMCHALGIEYILIDDTDFGDVYKSLRLVVQNKLYLVEKQFDYINSDLPEDTQKKQMVFLRRN